MKEISVVSPIYNSEKIIEKFVETILIEINKLSKNYELILFDDSSTDKTWEKLKICKHKNKNIKIYKNSKNCGQHKTIHSALKRTSSQNVFIIDCDLQDHPKFFSKFLKSSKNDHSTALFGKISKKSYDKGITSVLYWKIFSLLTNIEYSHRTTTFCLLRSKPLLILKKKSKIEFIYADLVRSNIKVKLVTYNRDRRLIGKSSYSLFKLLKLGFNLLWKYNKYL